MPSYTHTLRGNLRLWPRNVALFDKARIGSPTKTELLTRLLWAAVLVLPVAAQAQFTFTNNNGTLTITGYTGPGGSVTIPGRIPDATNGLPVTSIGDNAFVNTSAVTNVTIPNSVTNIGDLAFEGCQSLTSVLIPDSVINIGQEAFELCRSLTSVTIPESVTSIEAGAFYQCYSLTAITVATRNSVYSDLDGVLFNKSLTTLIEYPNGNAV
jgi:hypothetical protein